MTTPIEPNGMTYPTTPVVLVAPTQAAALDEMRQYGMDADALAYVSICLTVADLQGQDAPKPWAVLDGVAADVLTVARARLGAPTTVSALFAIVNNNVVLRGKKRGTVG